MKVVYLKLINLVPSYVGEGSLERSNDSSPRNNYHLRVLQGKNFPHECSVVVSKHSDKVGSVLQEQGFISWFGRRLTNEGTLTNILPFGDLGHEGKLPEEIETKRRNKIGQTVRENLDKVYYDSKHSEHISEGHEKRTRKLFGETGKRVQSWWLRSREFDSPLPESNNRQHPELSHKVLELLMEETFSLSIIRRLRKGFDFGGKLEDVTYEEFEKQWKRVKLETQRTPRHFEKNTKKKS